MGLWLRFYVILSALSIIASPRHARASACDQDVDANRSLAITHLSVVDDQRTNRSGPWSFATIFRRAAADAADAGRIAYDWLHQYSTARSFNGFVLPERSSGPLFAIWPQKLESSALRATLDLEKSPFKLLAIIFRPDLADARYFGEGRFVFGVLDPRRGPQDMTVIFEFALKPTPNLPSRQSWYKAIAKLSHFTEGEAYNRALQRLTDEFSYPYGQTSQLRRLRSNDQYFGQGWDLREFRFSHRERRFMMQAVDKTPDASLNTTELSPLVQWLQSNRAQVLAGTHQLPTEFASASSFLLDDGFDWFAGNPSIDEDLRQAFAKTTCSGCHGRATATEFLHLSPREPYAETVRSAFLQGQLVERVEHLRAALCED